MNSLKPKRVLTFRIYQLGYDLWSWTLFNKTDGRVEYLDYGKEASENAAKKAAIESLLLLISNQELETK